MRCLKDRPVLCMTQCFIVISSIIFSPSTLAQKLLMPLSLRLGPAIGFPSSVELPTGTDVTVIQRRYDWLLVVDEREESGWARISDVEVSGGLADRQAWRLSELKKKSLGDLQGRWFDNGRGYGLALGWKLRTANGHWLAEIERASDSQLQWRALSTWYAFDYALTSRSYYSAGLGLGYAQKEEHDRIFYNERNSSSTLFTGIEFALGVLPIKQVDTGLSVRYLQTRSYSDVSSTVISWYWSFGI